MVANVFCNPFVNPACTWDINTTTHLNNPSPDRFLTWSTELGLLTNLEYLRLQSKQYIGFTGIPTEIGKLTKLTHLEMFFNGPYTTLPTEMGNLESLQVFLAVATAIEGTLPTELGKLTNLGVIALQGNAISGPIPTEFGNLSNLAELYLFQNSLTGKLPTEFGTMSTLTTIRLQDNQLTEVFNPEYLSKPRANTASEDYRNNPLKTIDCDCAFFARFQALHDASNNNVLGRLTEENFVCSDNNAYNGISTYLLKNADEPKPCAFAQIQESELVASSSSVTMVWTYDRNVTAANLIVSIDNITQSSVNLNGSLEIFRDCGDFAIVDEEEIPENLKVTGSRVLGFMFTFYKGGRTAAKACMIENEATILGDLYSYTSASLTPASSYEVTIRPFFLLSTKADTLSQYYIDLVKGVESKRGSFQTEPAVPEGRVRNISLAFTDSFSTVLEWNPPVEDLQGGEIESYSIEVVNIQGEVSVYESPIASVTIVSGLEPENSYLARVRATTRVPGFGPYSEDFMFTTCKRNTQREGSEPCIAQRGYFLTSGGEVLRCLDFADTINLDCNLEGLTVQNLTLQPGYWRTTAESSDIRSCAIEGCSTVNGTSFGEAICNEFSSGPLCGVCDSGYFINGASCISCDDADSESLLAIGIIGLIVLSFASAVAYLFKKRLQRFSGEVVHRFERTGFQVGVFVATYQILGTFPLTLGVDLPPTASSIFSLGGLLTIDLFSLFPASACSLQWNYFDELVATVVIPLCCFVIVILVTIGWIMFKLPSTETRRQVISAATQVILVLYLFFYPSVTNKAFRALRPCLEFDDGTSALVEDLSISCNSDLYTQLSSVSYATIVLYCLGIPLLLLGYAAYHRSKIKEYHAIRTESPTSPELVQYEESYGALVSLCEPYSMWWWPIYEIIRKLVLTGFIVLISPGEETQVYALIGFSMVSLLVTRYFLPSVWGFNSLLLAHAIAIYGICCLIFLLRVQESITTSTLFDVVLSIAVVVPLVVSTAAFALHLGYTMSSSSLFGRIKEKFGVVNRDKTLDVQD